MIVGGKLDDFNETSMVDLFPLNVAENGQCPMTESFPVEIEEALAMMSFNGNPIICGGASAEAGSAQGTACYE